MARPLDSIDSASEAVLDCRDMGHAWRRSDDTNLVTDSRGNYIEFSRVDECGRCGASRTRKMELPSFRIISSTMRYPDGYLAPRGARYTRADARAASFHRLVSGAR